MIGKQELSTDESWIDSGVDTSTPSTCTYSSTSSTSGSGSISTAHQCSKRKLSCLPKRKLFRNLDDQENNEDAPVSLKGRIKTEDRFAVPLSERQQLALVLQISSKEASISPECETTKHKKPPKSKREVCKRNERGETLLHVASIRGDLQKLRRLIKQGANVNVTDFAGWSPLHEACIHGWLNVAKILIKAGANVNAQGLGRDSPLHDAAVNNHVHLVELLLQHGADPLQKNSRWKTPVDVARSEKVVHILKSFCENNPPENNSTVKIEREVSDFSVPTLHQPLGTTGTLWQSTLPTSVNSLSQSTMRKNSSQNQAHKGAEKPTSPRLTLRFQSIKTKDDKSSGSSKANDVSSSQPKYQTYCVTMETRDVYEFQKDDSCVSSTRILPVTETSDSRTDAVTSSSSKNPELTVNNPTSTSDGQGDIDVPSQSADSTDSLCSKVNGGRPNNDISLSEYDYCSETEKEDNSRKRRRSNENSSSSKTAITLGSTSQRSQRVQGPTTRPTHPESHTEQKSSPKTKKKGSLSSSDTETTQSDIENEPVNKCSPLDTSTVNQNGSPPSGPHSPKVPPIKIVIPLVSGSLETETRERNKISALKQALPYVVSAEQIDTTADTSINSATQLDGIKEGLKLDSLISAKSKDLDSHHAEERFHRVTRSSHRMALANAGTMPIMINPSSANSVSSNEASSHSVAVSCGQKSEQSGESSTDEHNLNPVDLHPRKRKLRTRDGDMSLPIASSASSSSSICDEQQTQAANCYQMYLNIRKQVDKRRKSMFVVHPKPPQGFKDYLLNRCSYVLEGNAASRISVPMIPPPQSLAGCMKDLFIQQEKERYKLRLQHLIEREKLVLSAEQEILRVHGRAARAMANQSVPLSVCTILKDEEIYNILELEQESSFVLRKKALKTRGQWNGNAPETPEDKDKNVRSRYNGRLFLSWLQDVDDKWEKIKEAMLLRHHNEAESLHAVQKLDWEWKLKELTMCDVRSTPVIDDIYVPMVHVSDDFDLLPA